MEIAVQNVKARERTQEGYFPLVLQTNRGDIQCRYYYAGAERVVVMYVGGVGGGFDTPARELYPKLCQNLLREGVGGLRLRFRSPIDLTESVMDVSAGITFLESRGVRSIALVGYSFGGAVVVRAGVLFDTVKAIVALSTQSYGADKAGELHDTPLLLIHGASDTVLPPTSSVFMYEHASPPKNLALLEGAGHNLDEKAEEVYELVDIWLQEQLLS